MNVNPAKVAFFAACAALVFAYGLAVGKYRLFPHDPIAFALESARTVLAQRETILRTTPAEFLSAARYAGSGVTRNDADAAPGLTLMSGFFDRANELRLVALDGTIVHRWRPSFSASFPNIEHVVPPEARPASEWNIDIHGVLALPDGSVVLNFEYGGLVKLDRCGKVVWQLPLMTHHSVAEASDGGFWVASRRYVTTQGQFAPTEPPYWEDTILHVTSDGRVSSERSVPEAIYRSGLAALMLTNGGATPFRGVRELVHLNDIEELPASLSPAFPEFAPGDLMISLATQNVVAVLDSNAMHVKWWQVGPWIAQHDPDFLQDGTIAVFDNNWDGSEDGALFGGSRLIRITPSSRQLSVDYGTRSGQHFYTRVRGKHQWLPNGNVLVTEHSAGRVFEVTRQGRLVWEYVNRYDADRVAHVTQAERYPPGFFLVSQWSCS